MRVPEEEKRGQKKLFKDIIVKNFSNLGREMHIQIHIIIKMLKIKDKRRIFKAAREKQLVTYKVISISL